MRIPIDIYNFVMTAFSNDLELSKWSMVINGFYMVENLAAVVAMAVFTVSMIVQAIYAIAVGEVNWESLSWESLGSLGSWTLMYLALFVPSIILLITQVNAFLYIYMSNEGVDLLSDVIFA